MAETPGSAGLSIAETESGALVGLENESGGILGWDLAEGASTIVRGPLEGSNGTEGVAWNEAGTTKAKGAVCVETSADGRFVVVAATGAWRAKENVEPTCCTDVGGV